MFDPTAFIVDGRWGYICCYTGCDYVQGTPKRILWNPLRWQVGLGKDRPCYIVLNRNGKAHIAVSKLFHRLRNWP